LLEVLKVKLKLRKLALEWVFWANSIGKAAKNLLGECETYVFCSVVEGKATGGSDVDILIVSDKIPENSRGRGNLKAKIEEMAGLPLSHPFEIHLANKHDFEWYRRHIKKVVKI